MGGGVISAEVSDIPQSIAVVPYFIDGLACGAYCMRVAAKSTMMELALDGSA